MHERTRRLEKSVNRHFAAFSPFFKRGLIRAKPNTSSLQGMLIPRAPPGGPRLARRGKPRERAWLTAAASFILPPALGWIHQARNDTPPVMILPQRVREHFYRYLAGVILVCGLGVSLVYVPESSKEDPFDRLDHNKRILNSCHGAGLRLISYDYLFLLDYYLGFRKRETPDEFIIVYLDEVSHHKLKQPFDRAWDRMFHAKLLDVLGGQGARLVFFDVNFDNPSSRPESDEAFAKAIGRNGPVVLAATEQVNYYDGYAQRQTLKPHSTFRRAAKSWGLVTLYKDPDTGVRMINPGNAMIPAATWRCALLLNPALESSLKPRIEERWLNYLGPPGTVAAQSFYRALPGKETLPENYFKNKIVFIGAKLDTGFSGSYKDSFKTPYNRIGFPETNGVEIQAHIMANFLQTNWFTRIDNRREMLIVGLLGLLLVVFLVSMSPLWATVTTLLFIGVFGYISVWYAWNTKLFYSWLVPVGVQAPVALVWSVGLQYYAEIRRKARLKKSFSAYLSPVMVRRMVDSGEEPQLGGHDENITCFFSDVQGFSSFSEVMSSRELVDLMNEYLTAMTDILQEEGGTLDKYIGDAIVAMFGAPLALKDHAQRACVAAHRMQMRQAELREKWKNEGDKWPPLVEKMRTRIGLNTGLTTIGNIGSQNRFNYTMMGDPVNLAARCESGAKSYGVYTMVTEDTKTAAQASGGQCVFRFLDRIIVKGRTKPAGVFEIVCFKEQLDGKLNKFMETWDQAIEKYLAQDWAAAQSLFSRAAMIEPNQPGRSPGVKINPSLLMIRRCQHLKNNPPPEDWDGVYVMETK